MKFVPTSLPRLASQVTVLQPIARAVIQRLPFGFSFELNDLSERSGESNPGIIVNINFCADDDTSEASGGDLRDACCGSSPWFGLEGYDSA